MLDAAAPDIVALEGVTKRFPGVLANYRIDLSIRAGEVHALLGENGAGKSTLVAMLSGLQKPDEGRILIDGVPTVIRSPRHALALGVGAVFQHAMLAPTLTVVENMLLGAPWWSRPRRSALAAEAEEAARALGISINLHARAADLSLGEQQQAEILRAVVRGSRVLVLDESTSMLTPSGVEELGALMRRMVARGLAIVFITHKLNEAVRFGDRVSVLKLGRKVGEIPPERIRRADVVDEIVEAMFGRRAAAVEGAPPPAAPVAPPVLEVRDLSLPPSEAGPGLSAVSLSLGGGEILGVAGIDGHGQKQLAEALAGQISPSAGEIRLDGAPITRLGVRQRRLLGLRYLTDDRLLEGTVGVFPVATNLVLKEIGAAPYWRRGIERRAAIADRASDLVRAHDVRTPGVHTPVGKLSGGNIQKVLLARELVEGARVVIFSKPTYGLDLANARASHQRIRDLAARGIGVLLISTDLEELLSLCHRVAVMATGEIRGVVPNGPEAHAAIGRLMVGLPA